MQEYGQARETISVGDKILCERIDTTHGNSVVLTEVVEVTEHTVKLRSIEVFYYSGDVLPEVNDSEAPRDYFKDSIFTRVKQNNEFFKAKIFGEFQK